MKSGPPPWFDLKKYRAAAELNAQQWARQLSIRFYVLDLLEMGGEDYIDDAGVTPAIAACREYGIVPDQVDVSPSSNEFCSELLAPPAPPEEQGTYSASRSAVRLQSWARCVEYLELLAIRSNRASETDETEADRHVTQVLEMFFTGQARFVEMSDELRRAVRAHSHVTFHKVISVFENFRPYVAQFDVDLSMTDDALMAAFKLAIQHARDTLGIEDKKFSRAKAKTWAPNQILPYLDLYIWNQWEHAKKTHAQLSSWLFPDFLDAVEKLRKGTIVHVDALRAPGVVASLAMQVG